MGFRFRKSIRIIPGVRINFGKQSSSLSFGGKGFTTNVSSKGVRNTVSLPGTGLSYSTYQKHSNLPAPAANSQPSRRLKALGLVVLAVVVIAVITALISS